MLNSCEYFHHCINKQVKCIIYNKSITDQKKKRSITQNTTLMSNRQIRQKKNIYSLYITQNKRTFWQPWTLYLSAVQVLIRHSIFDLLPIFTEAKIKQILTANKQLPSFQMPVAHCSHMIRYRNHN